MSDVSTNPQLELPEVFSGHPEPLLPWFVSGIGDLGDLEVSLPEPKSERVSYQLVGRRYTEQEGALAYPPTEIGADITATAQIPWDNYTQDFTYKVTAYLERRFWFTVNVVADLDRAFSYRVQVRFQTPDQQAHTISEDPTETTLREEESPKLLFQETLRDRADALVADWAEANDYDLWQLNVLSREVVIDNSDRIEVTVDDDYVYVSTEGTHFEGSTTWNDQTVTAYDSPKTLSGMVVYDVIPYNSLGEELDQIILAQGTVTYHYELLTNESEAEVVFALSGTQETSQIEDYVQASYDVTIESNELSDRVIHPEEAVIPNPLDAAGAARYHLEILDATDGVTGHFRSADGLRESDTTDSAAGAWTTEPGDFLVFTVTSPDSGSTTWTSQPPYRVVALANPAGDRVPAVVPIEPSSFGIPDEAIDISLSASVAYALLQDGSGTDVLGFSSARFTASGGETIGPFQDISQLEGEDLSVELASSYSEEHTRQVLIEETLDQGTGIVQIYGETVVTEVPVPPGYIWSSFIVRTSSPNVVLRTEVSGGKVRVLGRVSTSGGRWEPQIAPGTYYHNQLEYVKLQSPAYFTIRPDMRQTIETGATVAILDGGSLLGRIRVQARKGVWGQLLHRFPLQRLVEAVEERAVSDLQVMVDSGPIVVDLNSDGILATGEDFSEPPSGTFHLVDGKVTLPVEFPLSGPVVAWDAEDPARSFFRMDEWAEDGFEREIKLIGNGHAFIPLPVPYASLIAAFDGENEITNELDILGPALVRPGGMFEFGKSYRVRIRAREAFGVVGPGPELTLRFSENISKVIVACEQANSTRRSEKLEVHVPYTDPETGDQVVEKWVPDVEQITLFPFDNPHDRGFIALSLEKRAPSMIRIYAEPKHIQAGVNGLPVTAIIRVDDARGNPVGGEVVRVKGSWLSESFYVRTDAYGFASLSIPGPETDGVYTITGYVRSLNASSEVIVH